jgi:hypothetical protein
MPFKLINAPVTFQAYINKILKDLLDITCVAYLNNIYIYSDSIEKHAKYVREIFDRLKKISVRALANRDYLGDWFARITHKGHSPFACIAPKALP